MAGASASGTGWGVREGGEKGAPFDFPFDPSTSSGLRVRSRRTELKDTLRKTVRSEPFNRLRTGYAAAAAKSKNGFWLVANGNRISKKTKSGRSVTA